MPCSLHLLGKTTASSQQINNTSCIRDMEGWNERMQKVGGLWTHHHGLAEIWSVLHISGRSCVMLIPCTCTNCSRTVAREGLEGASGNTCISCRDLKGQLLLMCFYEGAQFNNIWMSRVSPAVCWETWFLRRKQRWKEGTWFPQWSQTFSPLVAEEDEQQLLGFFHGKRSLCGEGARRPWG